MLPPPDGKNILPILSHLGECYKLWHGFFARLPKPIRNTLGLKTDNIFIECLELSFFAAYAARQDKVVLVKRLSVKFDLLKFFLKLLWEMKALENNKYIALSSRLLVTGKMLGGWLKNLGQ